MFVLPGDVDAKKHALDLEIASFDAAVQAGASNVPAALLGTWNGWAKGARDFCARPTGFWTAGDENDEELAKEGELDAWRAQLSPMLKIPTPPKTGGDGPNPKTPVDWKAIGTVGAFIAGTLALASIVRSVTSVLPRCAQRP